ncbi:MAG: transglutaminase domain-containing protein [Acidobacteriota bacterium]
MKFFSTLFIAALITSAATPLGAATVDEAWYRVEVAGTPAGWMVERAIDDGQRLMTETDLQISFRRGGTALRLGMASRFLETRDHQPLEMWTWQELGAAPQEITYRFVDDGVLRTTAAGETRVDRPAGEWLTPFAADRRLQEEAGALLATDPPEDGVRSLEIPIVDPSLGLQVVSTRWVLEKKSVTFSDGDRRIPASRWRQSQSFAPQIESVVLLDGDGSMLSSTTPMMGLEIRFVRSEREAAQAFGDGPELLVQSFIYPDRRLENPRQLRRAAYRVAVDGEPAELPSLGAQRTDAGRVIVDLDRIAPEPLTDGDRRRYLAPSTYLDFTAPAIVALHAAAVDGRPAELPAAERARALRRLVNRHLDEKNLDSILATAGDAAASRSGDCTEHAVLLSALLRADGIPARVATGVIYVDAFAGKRHLFAYHMWSQAYLDGRWIDLDATLADGVDYDAAHLIFDIPDLDDEGAALVHMAGVAPLIGRASIDVLIDAVKTPAGAQDPPAKAAGGP